MRKGKVVGMTVFAVCVLLSVRIASLDNEEDAAMEATNSVAYTNNVLAPILADMEEADRLFVEAIGDEDDAIISDTFDQSHLLYLKARHDLTEPQGVDKKTYSAYSSLDSAIERYTSGIAQIKDGLYEEGMKDYNQGHESMFLVETYLTE